MAQHDSLAATRRFLVRSYAADYAGFVILLAGLFLTQFLITPFHRLFYLSNHNLQFPHAEIERVPVPLLFIYASVLPLLFLLCWAIITKPGWHKTHVTILGLFISIVLTSFLTDVIKNSVGRPRPDLIDRCKPKEGTERDKLVGIEICTETEHHRLHDGWRSFPSGHSSFAFAGLGYLALFIAGQLHVLRPRRTDLARFLLAMMPLLVALLIAISRCEDYRHDVYDVTIGSFLGFTVAHHTYRRYYPTLRSSRCDMPYPVKQDTERKHGFGRVRDEEDVSLEGSVEGIPLQERKGKNRA